MSSSAAERLKSSLTALAPASIRSTAGRIALAAGAAALPVGVLGAVGQSGPLMAVAAGALAVAAGFGIAGSLAGGRDQRMSTERRAEAFDHLVEHVRDAMLQFNAAGELAVASKSCRKLFGCAGYELAGSGLADRTHVLDRPLYMTAFAAAHKDGTERVIEVRMRRDSDRPGQVAPAYIWVEINFSPIRQGDAGPYGVIALLRDISRRKQSEKRMQEAQKTAEEASRAKSQFLAVIGHELRTPLNAIVGFSDMMSNGIGGELAPAHAEYAGLISQSGHHLLEVVNMLLDMSRIEAGRFELNTERFAPDDLVAPCLKIVSKAAQEKNVAIDVQKGDSLPDVVGDERACRQILINLLSNAIKFSEPGGQVTWSMQQRGQVLSLSVADTGIGMDSESLARLGEPFFQAETDADRRYEGTGLGMSIVKGLVELHDGTIKVASEPGHGTRVTVMLPINGPETKSGENDSVTPLRPGTDDAEPEKWAEPKRMVQ